MFGHSSPRGPRAASKHTRLGNSIFAHPPPLTHSAAIYAASVPRLRKGVEAKLPPYAIISREFWHDRRPVLKSRRTTGKINAGHGLARGGSSGSSLHAARRNQWCDAHIGAAVGRLAGGHFTRKFNLNEGIYPWITKTAAAIVAAQRWTTTCHTTSTPNRCVGVHAAGSEPHR